MNSPDRLTYVYAVTRPTDALGEALAGLRGIGEAPVRLLTPGGAAPAGVSFPLAFVVGDVLEREFNETALKDHFEDLRWLEYVARTHHDVVQAVAAHASVLPLRMATVYQDDHRARQALGDQHATFSRRLDQLRDHTEYGVKIYLDPATAGSRPPDAPAAPPAPTSPGKAYLQARRAQHDAREAVHHQARQAAEIIEAVAARHATLRVRHAPQRGALTGPQENVLNDAYLVPDEQAGEFRAAIADAARGFPDLRIEVTGPWAPYSFATPPADPPGPADAHEPPP
ncbi:GvpL/GvpF family gas vesicle protein [Streptomyces sp. NPDC057011]|uniref:GvpL/GvpF family gas vesicle protein n=1 Tax=unclassified Streptomyces TaxID=2593676 RepID=UPI00362675BD